MEKREFTGVWIPKHILEDKSLKPVDRLIYAEISCFEVCTMTNATLAERAGCSEDTASRSVGRLKEFGYVVVIGFDGRVRKMQSLHIVPPQNAEAASAKPRKLPPQNKAQDNNIDNKEITVLSKDNKPEAEEYGNTDINSMFEYWNEVTGTKIVGRVQQNRYACKNLTKKHTVDGLKTLIRVVAASQQDRYAPRVSDFSSLQAKQNDLIIWAKQQANTSNNKIVSF